MEYLFSKLPKVWKLETPSDRHWAVLVAGSTACVPWWEITCYRSPRVHHCARCTHKSGILFWEEKNFLFVGYFTEWDDVGMSWVLLVEKRNLYSPFSDTWHVGPPQVGRHLAHPPRTLLLHFCQTDSHCTCGCPLWACGGVTCKMSLPAVTSPKAQWLTPKLMALPPAGEDGDDHECINMPPKIKMTKLHKTLNTCKI